MLSRRLVWLVVPIGLAAGGFMLARMKPAAVVSDSPGNIYREPKHPVTPQMKAATDAKTQTTAPVIRGIDREGRPYEVDPAKGDLPTVVIAIKDGCPCSLESQPFFNLLGEAYGQSVRFVGLIDKDRVTAANYMDDFRVPFTVLYDPKARTARAYDMPRSVYVSVIDPAGKVVRAYPGYSRDMLADLNRLLAKVTGRPEAKLDLAMAPVKPTSGCEYDAAPEAATR